MFSKISSTWGEISPAEFIFTDYNPAATKSASFAKLMAEILLSCLLVMGCAYSLKAVEQKLNQQETGSNFLSAAEISSAYLPNLICEQFQKGYLGLNLIEMSGQLP